MNTKLRKKTKSIIAPQLDWTVCISKMNCLYVQVNTVCQKWTVCISKMNCLYAQLNSLYAHVNTVCPSEQFVCPMILFYHISDTGVCFTNTLLQYCLLFLQSSKKETSDHCPTLSHVQPSGKTTTVGYCNILVKSAKINNSRIL